MDELRDDAARLRYAGWDPFCQAQYLETTVLLPGYILSSQGDRDADGQLASRDVARSSTIASPSSPRRLPPVFKMKVLNEKYLLKKAAADLLPPFLPKRPKQPYRATEVPSFFDAAGRGRASTTSRSCCRRRALRSTAVFDPDGGGRLVAQGTRGPGGGRQGRHGAGARALDPAGRRLKLMGRPA